MKVLLSSITQGFSFDGYHVTPEEYIVGVARVSSGRSDDELYQDYTKLIKYLVKNHHWSPFEMASMGIYIETSRAIAQQILRHRSFSFQEFSQRYAKAGDYEPVELRLQHQNNRQSSTNKIVDVDLNQLVEDIIQRSFDSYEELVDNGVAKETARFVLPLATTTKMYMHGTVRSWIHYLQIRVDEHTQKEHREIAEAIMDIFKQNFPDIWEAVFNQPE